MHWSPEEVTRLKELVDTGTPHPDISTCLGRSLDAVQNKVRRMRSVDWVVPTRAPPPETWVRSTETPPEEWATKEDLLKRLSKKRIPLRSEEVVLALALCKEGYQIALIEEDGVVWGNLVRNVELPDKPQQPCLAEQLNTQQICLGLVADKQYGSKYALPDVADQLHAELEKAGAQVIYDLGDVFDGIAMYRGHEFELSHNGADAQLEEGVKRYHKLASRRG